MEGKKGLVLNVLWSLSGQFMFMFIIFITNILLAKKLTPIEFGQIGIVMFFVNLFNVLIESGLGGALVRKENVKPIDYSTVFVFNLGISITLYVILFFTSPLISNFYNDSNLEDILKITGIILLINAFQITQNTKLIKELQFKKLSLFRTISVFISSIVAIYLAYFTKNGVWCIVVMQLINVIINTILLNFSVGGLNQLFFSKDSFKSLYKFGVNTTLASVLNTIFDNIYNLILGKYFSIASTGFYYQAKKIQDVPVNVINTLNHGVIYSILSKIQSNPENYYSFHKLVFRYLVFFVGFVTLGMFIFSDNIIQIVLGDKWIESAIYMKYLSIFSFFFLLEQYNRVTFKVFNKTHKILYLEIIKKIIQSVTIFIGVYLKSLEILMQGLVFTAIISYMINYISARNIFKFIQNYELVQLVRIIFISLFLIIICNNLHINFILRITLYGLFFTLFGFIFQIIKISDIKKIKYD